MPQLAPPAGAESVTPTAQPGQGGRAKGKSTFLMLLATALLLPLLFPPFYCYFLAPVALVPFLICVLRRPLNKRHLLAYYLLGVAFFLPNLFWICPVTVFGFVALALFVALYFPIFAIGLHRLVIQLRLPATIAVPLVWTAVEYYRASFVLGGFPWFLLGNSLTPNAVLLQAADLFGVWGLSFFIAMINGFFVDLLRLPLRSPRPDTGAFQFNPGIGRLIAGVALAVAFVFAYGVYRLNQQTTVPGPRVAVLQENIPQEIKDDPKSRDDVFMKYLALNDQALSATPRPDLVAWPETMVPAPVNAELLRGRPDPFATPEELHQALARATASNDQFAEYQRIDDIYFALARRATEFNTPLLLGYGAYIPSDPPQPSILQNRTMLMVPANPAAPLSTRALQQRAQEYSKIHLVPFGEFIPFRSVPGIKQLMMLFSPVDFDYSNTPGDRWTRFLLQVPPVPSSPAGTAPSPPPPPAAGVPAASTGRTCTFGTPICFEDTMPYPARMMSAPQFADGRKADFLLNVSNDGWFFRTELDQHLQACQLRAVENRIAIARAVNTGNSGFIDSNGRIMGLVTSPASGGGSIGAIGTLAMVLPIDSRVTLFAHIGDLLPIICGIVATVLVGWTFARPRRG